MTRDAANFEHAGDRDQVGGSFKRICRGGTAAAIAIAILSSVAMARRVAADAPLRPPERHSVCSRSGAVCATSDPKLGTWVHPADAKERSSALWTIPGWYRALWVTDDGGRLITGYDGLNLVPQAEPSATTILTFWESGRLLKAYTLADLGYSPSSLEKTASHYHWGNYAGVGDDGKFRLTMLDGVSLVFEPETGSLIRREHAT